VTLLWWHCCGDTVVVTLLLWHCCCGTVVVTLLLWRCSATVVVPLLWRCGDTVVVTLLLWHCCGDTIVVALLWWHCCCDAVLPLLLCHCCDVVVTLLLWHCCCDTVVANERFDVYLLHVSLLVHSHQGEQISQLLEKPTTITILLSMGPILQLMFQEHNCMIKTYVQLVVHHLGLRLWLSSNT